MNVREEAVVTRLHELAPHLDGEPDPAFRAATRARLVAMAAVRSPEPAPASRLQRLFRRAGDVAPSPWRGRLTAGLAGAAVAVTALAGLVAVATDAVPGDALYSVKRGTEEAQLALAGDATRGQILLGFASTRLEELEALVSGDSAALPAAGGAAGSTTVLAAGADAGLVLDTIETMDAQTTDGAAWLAERAVATGDEGPLDDLGTWADHQSAGLAALRPEVPAEAREAIAASLTLLSDVTVRTTGLQDALGCAYGPAVTGSDELGPVPALCVPDQATPGGSAPGRTGSGGGGLPGTDPSVPGTGSVPQATIPALPTLPSPGGTGGLPSVGVPGVGVPGLPTTTSGGGRLPVPSLPTPLPSVPLPLPSVSLPGTTLPSLGGSVPVDEPDLPLPSVSVCLPPVQIGSC